MKKNLTKKFRWVLVGVLAFLLAIVGAWYLVLLSQWNAQNEELLRAYPRQGRLIHAPQGGLQVEELGSHERLEQCQVVTSRRPRAGDEVGFRVVGVRVEAVAIECKKIVVTLQPLKRKQDKPTP